MYKIYKAKHKPSGRFYIGYTSQEMQCRIGQHWAAVKNRRKPFQEFLHTTLMSEWEWTILHTVATYKEARDCELHYIKTLNAYDYGLNCPTGTQTNFQAREAASKRLKAYKEQNPTPWNKGRKGISEETRMLMSKAKLDNPVRNYWKPERRAKQILENKQRKALVHVQTGTVYPSVSECARALGLRREGVRDVLNGRRSHVNGQTFVPADSFTKIT